MYVDVYKNLNKKGLFSIRCRKTGLMVAYAQSVTLKDFGMSLVRNKVRVLERQVQSVHNCILC